MIIDFHAHVGDLRAPDTPAGFTPVTGDDLVRRLDREGIDRAVVLPMPPTPESLHFPALLSGPDTMGQIREALRHPDRLIPFGSLDPRLAGAGNRDPSRVGNSAATDFSWILERFVAMGCAGIGELTANLPCDDPRVVNLVRQCGERGLPVLFHGTGPGPGLYGLADEAGSPRLERLLRQAPGAVLVAHGPGVWSEIAADVTDESKAAYGEGPVRREGSLPRLLRAYPNLCADISAMSGYRALSRDRAFGARFLGEFRDRLLFGTDTCFGGEAPGMPHLEYLRGLLAEGAIDRETFARVTGGNALRLLARHRPAGRPAQR